MTEGPPTPEARVDLGDAGPSGDDFQILVGESLLAITGEYESTEWSSLRPRGDADVEHPGDDGAGLGGGSDRRDSGGLRVTQESGLDWDSWEYGRNASPISSAADGLIINRHELPPEAADVGLTGGAVDEHGEDRFLRAEKRRAAPDEPAVPSTAAMPDETHDTEAPTPVASHEPVVAPTPPDALSMPVARSATPPASILAAAHDEGSSRADSRSAEMPSPVSAHDLETLKEVEPWALPPEPQPPRATATASDGVAERLERLAERVRRGELVVPVDTPAESDEAALAAVLSALFRTTRR